MRQNIRLEFECPINRKKYTKKKIKNDFKILKIYSVIKMNYVHYIL